MAKLLVALALAAAPSALAMAPYVPPELNGCDEPCADVITLSSPPLQPSQDGTCYVVDGTFPSNSITVPDGVNCAKLTVPSGSKLGFIEVYGKDTEIINEGEVYSPADGTKITNTGTDASTGYVNILVFGGSGTEITVSHPGKALVFDYVGSGVTFECYDTPVTVPPLGSVFCP